MLEVTPLLLTFITFVVVATSVVVAGRVLSSQASMQRRLPVPVFAAEAPPRKAPANFIGILANKIDEKKFGVNSALRTKLRRELVRAGFFSDEAIRYYVLARIGLVIGLPIVTYIFSATFLGTFEYMNLVLVAASAVIAIAGPDAYIARAQRHLQQQYRVIFRSEEHTSELQSHSDLVC